MSIYKFGGNPKDSGKQSAVVLKTKSDNAIMTETGLRSEGRSSMNHLQTTDPMVESLLSHLRAYTQAREKFLAQINMAVSCRDPLSEFSEVLIAKLLEGELAQSRVQKGYDLVTPDMRRVQVKYLANPNEKWINEHHICFTDDIDDYALAIYTRFVLQSVIVFPREKIGKVGRQLKKLHPNQEICLQLTKRNYTSIILNKSLFKALGVRLYLFDVIG